MSSICKKQIVAVTGLILILFVLGHLGGNLTIYGGPEMFNAYALKLKHLRPFLNLVEAVLLFVFVLHICVTALLVHENIKARGGMSRYAVDQAVGNRSLATKIMPYSGTYILLFVIWHLLDFTFIDHEGVRSMVAGQSLGIYGVVVNAFASPLHSVLYMIAVCFLGMHLAHGINSVIQTFGLKRPQILETVNRYVSLSIVLGYCSIPVYVLFFLPR